MEEFRRYGDLELGTRSDFSNSMSMFGFHHKLIFMIVLYVLLEEKFKFRYSTDMT